MTDPSLLARLALLDAPALCDALDKMGVVGGALGFHSLSVSRKIVGKVIPVRLAPSDNTPPARHLGVAAIDAAGPGDVIVIANEGRMGMACWGGTMSRGCVQRGVEGVIVDGACRDVAEAREIGFPIYARGRSHLAARGRVKEIAWNEPVTINGVEVAPGDYVLADENGVTFAPAASADEAADIAATIMEKERLMARRALEGRSMADVMGADYEAMLNASNKL